MSMHNPGQTVPAEPSARWLRLMPFGLVFLAGIVLQRSRETPEAPAGPETRTAAASHPPATPTRQPVSSPILPIHVAELDPRRVALGRLLFHDPRLSRDGTISCASCHEIEQGGDDGRVVSLGVGGARGSINAPTVLNSGFSFRQFWDGRAKTLEEQVDGPIQHPAEMAMDWPTVVAALEGDPRYAAEFRALYGAAPERGSISDAIATFERSLATPDSPFDRYLAGDEGALSVEARAGYELFLALGCVTCHQGVNAGGNMFQPMGKMKDYFAERGTPATAIDLGRFNVTGRELDRYAFKVPTLRNVEWTAPYFHDGTAATLEEAVQVMANVQLGEDLTPGEVASIVAFLRALTGRLPGSGLGHE